MKPLIASAIVALAIILLSRLNSDKGTRISRWLWLPLTWLVIGGTRPVSEWFAENVQQGANYEEGSPLDRTILLLLLTLAVTVLMKRRQKVAAILKANLPIVLFMLYCLVSTFWSDFPFVTFKRWIRGAGDIVMILVIITDEQWEAALGWVFTKLAFLLIPVSFLFIKFFPEYGRSYRTGGSPMWTGVCSDKNALGALCMLFGTAVLWQVLPVNRPSEKRSKQQFFAKAIVLAITLYLIFMIDSKTALMCFLLANTLIVLTWLGRIFRKPVMLTLIVITMIAVCYTVLFLGIGSGALETMGRESDLTGRTAIWATVLPLATNPLLGAGYEDFWMGERFETVARKLATLNQAHNGYLEIYLNLGWMGLFLLAMVILGGYKRLVSSLKENFELGRLKLAFFTICLVYNFTEATFKMMSPVWITFLWAVMAHPTAVVPQSDSERLELPDGAQLGPEHVPE
jgi:exopolysaccharide production protein ExoQ